MQNKKPGNGKNEIGDNDAQQDAADQYGCKDVCLVGMHAIAFVFNRLQFMRMKYRKQYVFFINVLPQY